jgi:hypothetical protein
VAFSHVGQHDGHSLVMAAMVRKTDLQQHIDLLAKAGLDPKTVTLAPLALAALIGRARNGAAPTAHMVVEGDESSTTMVLLDQTGTPRALRSISGSLLTADGAAITPDEASSILNSLRQTLLAHGGELEQTDIILAGAAGNIPQLRSLLADSLALAVRDGGDFDYTAIFEGKMPGTGKFTSCVAMLTSELPSAPSKLINFRQGEFLFRGRIRGDLTPFYTSGILAGALFAAILLHFILGVSAQVHRLNLINAEIEKVVAPVLGHTDPANARTDLHDGISKMNHRLRLIGGNLAQHSPLETLLAISRALPPRFPVEIGDMQIDGNAVHISGQADSFATVDAAKRALDKSEFFGTIEVSHAKAGTDPNKVDFKLDANFKDSSANAE